ncbi:MAG: cupredoxin domain-containing protein [Actinomycetota bacterium]|nr:cupredoxin domain-containing protein [Actinomycetota bacterium]
MARSSFVLSLAFLALVACGGGQEPAPRAASPTGGASPAAAPECTPSGTRLEITVTAKNDRFDKDCLAAPANTPFTIVFNNRHVATQACLPNCQHNISIETATGVRTLWAGDVVEGPKTVEYQVEPLPAGTYSFECDLHANRMRGTFVVA